MAAKKEVVTNDQGEIIKAIKKKNYDYVWEKVKYIGYMIIPDMLDRRLIFQPIVEEFKPSQNNNFIAFYKDHLKYNKSYQNKTFLITKNKHMVKKLIRQGISPDDDISKMVGELLNWETGGIID